MSGVLGGEPRGPSLSLNLIIYTHIYLRKLLILINYEYLIPMIIHH